MKNPELKTIKLLGGAEVVVDFSQLRVPCKKCRKLIRFGVTKKGKYMPIIEVGNDWQAHFADCKFADDFRKPVDLEKQIKDQEENERLLSEL